jgi:hypothetical protein
VTLHKTESLIHKEAEADQTRSKRGRQGIWKIWHKISHQMISDYSGCKNWDAFCPAWWQKKEILGLGIFKHYWLSLAKISSAFKTVALSIFVFALFARQKMSIIFVALDFIQKITLQGI